ncbi:predicted ABC-type molybdate/tungstate transporter, periplasmic substrate binding protein [Desulforapulum autotrophicum HRM2]|uniref:Predicted ABC-type molybdate/tungstate transporter, periplasmic substrate binding protein n=1 Tax=Desulforapulum autotrophicum (strain ATCC 43914 / DSM 3382 / VKM B-1955 / HRM2) TaxID=177437 RepID=C0QB67_DESAH|nr:substrate-binding domain-containing protein [Desulforapulum autotrophicum]ACN14866.1 predicted ABC-type molybdate/tungstate transporter, periplasmic substrate binding protein [Desulforapulum autotrophicum HRM2]
MKRTRLSFKTLILLMMITIIPLSAATAQEKKLMMATTTSTDNTGLLDYLMPLFSKDTNIEIKWTATGTGKALKLGERCDVDVLLVHAPAAEKRYIDAGFGKDRREIMYNDFVIIGPAADPAQVKGKTVKQALEIIRDNQSLFLSRGDDSGTNKKEKILWNQTGKPLPEKENWYIQTGQGMLATINAAEERMGYTMTDRGTFIKYQSQKGGTAPLQVLVEGDAILLNQYSVLTLDPKNCPNAQYDLAMIFSDWMAGEKAQTLIKEFRLLGQPLFTPNAK